MALIAYIYQHQNANDADWLSQFLRKELDRIFFPALLLAYHELNVEDLQTILYPKFSTTDDLSFRDELDIILRGSLAESPLISFLQAPISTLQQHLDLSGKARDPERLFKLFSYLFERALRTEGLLNRMDSRLVLAGQPPKRLNIIHTSQVISQLSKVETSASCVLAIQENPLPKQGNPEIRVRLFKRKDINGEFIELNYKSDSFSAEFDEIRKRDAVIFLSELLRSLRAEANWSSTTTISINMENNQEAKTGATKFIRCLESVNLSQMFETSKSEDLRIFKFGFPILLIGNPPQELRPIIRKVKSSR
ncbi:MAG: hypothetical protein HUU57_17010 [Bdellovibrio sp.]|nr:hypothetical protein [Bdellovibrio sp.]